MQIQERSYKVAGHIFSLRMKAEDGMWALLDNYAPYLYEGDGERIFTLELVGNLSVENKKALYVSNPKTNEQRLDVHFVKGGYLFEMAPSRNVPVCGLLKTSSDFNEAFLEADKYGKYCVNNALMILYAFRTAGMATLEMHASVVINDGKGYLFLGRSGTGKSTHSRLWLKNIPGTHLLNDDNPIVRIKDGTARVYGSPWSGKTACYLNEDYPVGAVVHINRANHNAIQRMNLPESFASVSSSSSGLRAIRPIADGLFATISSFVRTVPCYILDCLPDDEAAIVCANQVLKNEQDHL